MSAAPLVAILAGLVLLVAGAEALVRGASRLAAAAGLSSLVVGLTVVAWGTSAPEVAVSIDAARAGRGDVAVGNVLGSNIFNVLFILGVSALVTPLVVSRHLVVRDVPIMIGVSLLVALLAADGGVGPAEGALLVGLMGAHVLLLLRMGRGEPRETTPPAGGAPARRPLVDGGLVVAGLGLLVVGARWLVDGAVTIATALGVSELVVGLTVVAAGTSLPEVATSLVAAARGERDLAVGNVVGSNVFNLLGVLGLAALAAPEGLRVAEGALRFDVPVMIAAAIACLPIAFTGHLIARWEGALFLLYYVAYVLYVMLAAVEHDALPPFSALMMLFTLPLTAVTLLVLAARAWRVDGRARGTTAPGPARDD